MVLCFAEYAQCNTFSVAAPFSPTCPRARLCLQVQMFTPSPNKHDQRRPSSSSPNDAATESKSEAASQHHHHQEPEPAVRHALVITGAALRHLSATDKQQVQYATACVGGSVQRQH